MANNESLEKLTIRIQSLEQELNSVKQELDRLTSTNPEVKIAKPDFKPQIITPQIPKEIKSEKTSKSIDWEILLGGNILGKLGFTAILLAFGWFIKFAFDNHWINESGRIFIGLLIGFSTIAGGLFLAKQKMRIVPESMIGTGVSIIYLSLYGAYYYYDLITAKETFTAFTILSVGTSLLAGRSKLQILYIFSLVGSILAPILLSSGENSYRFLFIYLTIINLVFYYISITNSWRISPYLVFLSNCIIFSSWGSDKLLVSSPIPPLLYLTSLFLILGMREIYLMPRLRKTPEASSGILFILLAVSYAGFGYWVVNTFYPLVTSHFLLLEAFLLVGFFKIFQIYSLPTLQKTENTKFSLSGILFITWVSLLFLAISYFAEDRWICFSWILFSASLSISGSYFKNKTYLLVSLIPWFLALLNLYFIQSEYDRHIYFLLNSRFGLFALATMFLLLTYQIQKKFQVHQSMVGFVFTALFTIILGTLIEVYYLVKNPYFRNLGYSYVIAFYMIALLIPGFKLGYRSFRLTGIILGVLLISKFYLYDIWTMGIVVRIIAGFSLGIGLVLLSIIYQKYKDKMNVNQILKLTVFPFLLMSVLYSDNLSAETFNNKGYKYFSEIKGLNQEVVSDENNIYGKIRLTEEISRYHGSSDLRLVYNNELVPFFHRKVTNVSGKTGKTIPSVIYTNVTTNGRIYVLKLEEPPTKTEYTELEISGNQLYETGVYISLGEQPNDWNESTSASIYNYYDNEYGKVNRIKFRSGKYRYARLEFDTKHQFEFSGAIYSPTKEKAEYKLEIKLEDLSVQSDSDKKGTVYYYENPTHKQISRLVVNFEDTKYSRNLEIFQKDQHTKEFVLLAETLIHKKPDGKGEHNIDLPYFAGGQLKLLIVDNDDKPLTLKSIEAYAEIEEIVFELPKQNEFDENKKLILYYGNDYVRSPEFDIKTNYDEKLKHVSLKTNEHQQNPEFAYSMVEPPLSSWIIRGLFFLGLALMVYPAFSILKKYSSELKITQSKESQENSEKENLPV